MPPTWNGQLDVTGAPGVRTQYANDNIISDWALSQGYAFASTDKPSSGTSFFANGSRSAPAKPLLAWHERVSQVVVAAKQVLAQRYGTAPPTARSPCRSRSCGRSCRAVARSSCA